MQNLLEKLTTVSKNMVDLTPHYIDRDRNIKLLNALEARNAVKKSKNTYRYTDMLSKLKKRDTIQQLVNPQAYSSKAPERETAERAELLRMAKITANESRDPVSNVPTVDYVKNKENFLTTYMKKIAQFGLLPEVESIFEMFKNPDYTEKGFDKDYLAQGTSDQYLNSLRVKSQSDALIKKLEDLDALRSTDMGNITTALQTADRNHLAIGANTVEQLQMLRDEQEARQISKQQNKDYQKLIMNEAQDVLDQKKVLQKIVDGGGILTAEQQILLDLPKEIIIQEAEKKVESEYKQKEDEVIRATRDNLNKFKSIQLADSELKKPKEYVRGKAGVTKPYLDYVKEAYHILQAHNAISKTLENKYKTKYPIIDILPPDSTPEQILEIKRNNDNSRIKIALLEGENSFRKPKKYKTSGGGGSGSGGV